MTVQSDDGSRRPCREPSKEIVRPNAISFRLLLESLRLTGDCRSEGALAESEMPNFDVSFPANTRFSPRRWFCRRFPSKVPASVHEAGFFVNPL